MPDPLDLDTLEALANAATPGPWYYMTSGHRPVISGFTPYPHGTVLWAPRWDARNSDLAFIAVARTALPALIAEVRRLRAVEEAGGGLAYLRQLSEAFNFGDGTYRP
jgi:hypothetical protein